MDISQFLDVTCDVVDDVEEVDLPSLPQPPKAVKKTPVSNPLKRLNSVPSPLPPSKRAKPTNFTPSQAQRKAGGLTPTTNGNRKALSPANAARQAIRPNKASPLVQSSNPVSWKYKPLQENLYNGDIKKSELLKDYDPERCNCKAPENEGTPACGDGCINRSLYTECDKDVCPQGDRCSNQRLQRRQYAPGLERFMTQKKGWGVRARQSIPSGTLILEYLGELCTSGEFEKRMLTRYKGDTHHYCLAIDGKTLIDAQRAGSECRFVNHSCDPNCEMQKWHVNGLQRMAVFAKRDILPGEEICYDYNFSLFDRNHGQACKCGAKNCRGVIGGKGKDFADKNKMPATNAPMTISTQLASDAKYYSTKVTAQEMTWIKSNAPKFVQLDSRQIKCTVCNSALDYKVPGAVQRHPELGVIMCQTCRGNYGRGGWARDQQGSDEFCRWCSEGGQIYLCDFCPKAFCHKCLKWNLGKKYLTKIDNEDKWQCLACDGALLRPNKALYFAIHMFQKSQGSTNGKPVAKVATPRKSTTNNVGRPVKAATPPVQNGRSTVMKTSTPNSRKVPLLAQSSPSPATVSRNQIQQRHFVDAMLLEADRAINRMRGMVNDIRKKWTQAGVSNTRNQKMIVDVTEKIRDSFDLSVEGIQKADEKVVNLYKSNMKKPTLKQRKKINNDLEEKCVKESNVELDAGVDELEENGVKIDSELEIDSVKSENTTLDKPENDDTKEEEEILIDEKVLDVRELSSDDDNDVQEVQNQSADGSEIEIELDEKEFVTTNGNETENSEDVIEEVDIKNDTNEQAAEIEIDETEIDKCEQDKDTDTNGVEEEQEVEKVAEDSDIQIDNVCSADENDIASVDNNADGNSANLDKAENTDEESAIDQEEVEQSAESSDDAEVKSKENVTNGLKEVSVSEMEENEIEIDAMASKKVRESVDSIDTTEDEKHDDSEQTENENTEDEKLDDNHHSESENTEDEKHDDREQTENENTEGEKQDDNEHIENENKEDERQEDSEHNENENTEDESEQTEKEVIEHIDKETTPKTKTNNSEISGKGNDCKDREEKSEEVEPMETYEPMETTDPMETSGPIESNGCHESPETKPENEPHSLCKENTDLSNEHDDEIESKVNEKIASSKNEHGKDLLEDKELRI